MGAAFLKLIAVTVEAFGPPRDDVAESAVVELQ